MDSILGLLEGFATWQTPLSFFAGVGVHHIYCKYWRDREARFMFAQKENGDYRFSNRFWIYTVIATVVIGFIGFKTQATADKVENQAKLTAQCLSQVLSTIDTRTQINAENDEWSQRQRTALGTMLNGLINPPPEIDALPPDSTVRQNWAEEIVREQLKVINDAQVQQDANIADRMEHPYPPPDCPLVK